jgi:hypothetical protein
MYENGKMRPLETVRGMRREEIKENGGVDEVNYNILQELW